MPTSVEFRQAAVKFSEAASLVGDLTIEIDGLDAAQVLHGGRIGEEIPAGIVAASTSARTCQHLLESAATICEERALVMIEYEAELEIFNDGVQKYNEAWADWNYKIGLGKDIAHPDVAHPTPVIEPTWTDGPGPLVGATGDR